MELKNKTIIITGGTSGVGLALVEKLYGYNKLLILARSSDKLTKLKDLYPKIEIYPVDLSRVENVEKVAQAICLKHGYLDLLINNAASQNTATFLQPDFDCQSIQQEINLNFTAVCCLSFLLLPLLTQSDNQAAIVNINSALAVVPKTQSAVYCASKAALNLFSQSLRYQLAGTQVDVMQAFLPLVNTPMTKGRGKGKISPKQAAHSICLGIQRNKTTNYIGKVKLLMLIFSIAPWLARKILKG